MILLQTGGTQQQPSEPSVHVWRSSREHERVEAGSVASDGCLLLDLHTSTGLFLTGIFTLKHSLEGKGNHKELR